MLLPGYYLPDRTVIVSPQRACELLALEMISDLTNERPGAALRRYEIQKPKPVALIPLTEMKQDLRIIEQSLLDIVRQESPCYVTDEQPGRIAEDQYLAEYNRGNEPLRNARNGKLAI